MVPQSIIYFEFVAWFEALSHMFAVCSYRMSGIGLLMHNHDILYIVLKLLFCTFLSVLMFSYFVFMDNWFSNLIMFKVLAEKGIYCCGTSRANRTGFPPALKDLKLPQQGDSKTVQDGRLVVCS